MEPFDLNTKQKALKYAIWGGLASMVLIMFGSYYNTWQKQEFTSGDISCVKEPFAQWICTAPELEPLKSGPIDTKSRPKSEVLSEQDVIQLTHDKNFQLYRESPTVRAYINFAKEDGKITVNELENIHKLINEADTHKITATEKLVRDL